MQKSLDRHGLPEEINSPTGMRGSLLLTSLLLQIMAAILFIALFHKTFGMGNVTLSGALIFAAMVLFIVLVVTGTGKCEIPLSVSLVLFGLENERPFHFAIAVSLLVTLLLSIGSYFGSHRGKLGPLDSGFKGLNVFLGFVVCFETVLLIAGFSFAIWFAIAWGSSSHFG